MIWKTAQRDFDLSTGGLVMGVLNLTLDSFSDGGLHATARGTIDPEAAVAHALEMEAQGAAIIDIGGESTRPGAEPVSEAEELARVLPVLERLRGRLKAVISIDTTKAAVAAAAMEHGAAIINDITALRGDPAMAAVAAESGAGVILMHMQGTPRTMQQAPSYRDVVAEVRHFFLESRAFALEAGIGADRLAFDPGIGFGKTVEHNLLLLRHLDALRPEGHPLVLGVSRKTFLGKLLGEEGIDERFWPTVALTSLGRTFGANVVRVHDVQPNREALQMTGAILEHAG